MTNYFINISLILIPFLACLGLTVWVRKKLIQRALFDHPNKRSSHTVPTPRGGGWALLIVLIPSLILTAYKLDELAHYTGIILGLVLLALISWLDDHKGVSAFKRLSLHILAACLGSLTFASDQMLFSGALPFWLDRSLMIVGWAWFINLYNFMDGIDGITGAETIALATGTCLVMTVAGINDPFVQILVSLLTGVCLGFLVLNWHPAKIFLGDVGSVPLGFLTGFALLSLATKGHVISALILPLYYLADSGITLVKRAWRGEKIWQPHRQHFYQRAAQSLCRHDKVVGWICGANLVLLAASILALNCPILGLTGGIITIALLLVWMHKVKP